MSMIKGLPTRLVGLKADNGQHKGIAQIPYLTQKQNSPKYILPYASHTHITVLLLKHKLTIDLVEALKMFFTDMMETGHY